MREEGCTICGEKSSGGGFQRADQDTGYGITIGYTGVCEQHVTLLKKAFGGILFALSQAKAEQRERVLDRIFERLNQNGFELTAPEPSVVPPLYEKWRRRV